MPSPLPTPRRKRTSLNRNSISCNQNTVFKATSSRNVPQGSTAEPALRRPSSSNSADQGVFKTLQTELSDFPENVKDEIGNLADELAGALEEDDEDQIAPAHSLQDTEVKAIDDKSNTTPKKFQQSSTAQLDNRGKAAFDDSQIPTSHLLSDQVAISPAEKRNSGGENRGSTSPQRTLTRIDGHLATLEHLASHVRDDQHDHSEVTVQKFAHALRNLPAQSGVENGVSRLLASQIALTTHITNQGRSLQNLLRPITSPLLMMPSPDFFDDILPVIVALADAVPKQSRACLAALHELSLVTADLQSTMAFLSDSVYMSRQEIFSANRRLRNVTDVVQEIRREAEEREKAIQWLDEGGWQTRLIDRECKNICGEVVGGFEEICQQWRRALFPEFGTS